MNEREGLGFTEIPISIPIAFESEGATLRGFLLTPEATHLPAVIMAHGTTATISMVAIEYARFFARSGQLGTPSLLAPIQAYRWFIEHGGRPSSGWLNRVTRVIPPTPAPYSPYLCAPFMRVPVLLMVAPNDEMIHADYQVTKQVFQLMPGVKRWHDIADGHFGLLYHPSERFDEAVQVQAEFLHAQLATRNS